jgi:hypothetical protein
MAADSQVSCDGAKGFLTPKIFRVGNSLYGLAGDNFSNAFIEWAKRGFLLKEKNFIPDGAWHDANFEILELAPTGLFLWDKYLTRIAIKDDNYSVGHGSMFALLGMREMNLDPVEAVRLACKYDDYTNEPVDVFLLKEEGIEKPAKKP